MKISVVFPNVLYREGPEGVLKLIKAIENIGYDELDMFDHVVMGHPTETRRKPFYSPTMPILEALMVLSYAAAATTKIGLGVGVLVDERFAVVVHRSVQVAVDFADAVQVGGEGQISVANN